MPVFDAQAFLDSAGVAKTIVQYARGDIVFTQGDASRHVMYIQSGGVKLSVLSKTGREAVVAMLGPGTSSARAAWRTNPCAWKRHDDDPGTILRVRKGTLTHILHKHHDMSDRFISHMLARNIRIEEDLIDQLFNSSEKRLARALLLLARYGKQDTPVGIVPHVSQGTLPPSSTSGIAAASMGTSSRVAPRTPRHCRSGFDTEIWYSEPLKRQVISYSGHDEGMHGSTLNVAPRRRSPSMLSSPARYIHAADPVYQLHPPRPGVRRPRVDVARRRRTARPCSARRRRACACG